MAQLAAVLVAASLLVVGCHGGHERAVEEASGGGGSTPGGSSSTSDRGDHIEPAHSIGAPGGASVSLPGAGTGAPPSSAGFAAMAGLGNDCGASYAKRPADEYGPLSFKPCASGQAGCEEIQWDGEVEWDPPLLHWQAQVARDTNGDSTHLLVVHRYPRLTSLQGLPFEAVLYELPAGTPVAAYRNGGGGTGHDCEIVPVVGEGRLWLVGFASGTKAVSVASQPFAMLTTAPDFVPVDVDPSALYGRKVAGSELLALESDDGKIYRIDLDGHVIASYGPAKRVWLHGVVRSGVLVMNDQAAPPAAEFLRMDDRGEFVTMLPLGDALAADSQRLVWGQRGMIGAASLRAAPADRFPIDQMAAETLPLTGAGETVVQIALGDGHAVALSANTVITVTSNHGAPLLSNPVAQAVELAAPNTVSDVALDSGIYQPTLLGVEGRHVWVGTGANSGDDAYDTLVRLPF